ncbi:hypothetical protein GCM10028827_08880 [Mucilaginibacter myungsuensis]
MDLLGPAYKTTSLLKLKLRTPHLALQPLPMSDRELEVAQSYTMKAAQHSMRYRIYGQASYQFGLLADLYVRQSRYSEAKWYFLQSTNLARRQSDHKLILANLIKLAMLKYEIGDFALANQDLLDARNMASSKGWLIDLIEIEKKLNYIQHTRYAATRNTRYAAGVTFDMAFQE